MSDHKKCGTEADIISNYVNHLLTKYRLRFATLIITISNKTQHHEVSCDALVFIEYAWVTLATNDSYSLGALVVAHSLKRVHTEHQIAVLITPGVSESMKTKLRTVFNVVEEVNLLDSKDEANLALLKRPELGVTFTKLHCWRLIQFEKCVFLDADTLVLRNCDELFEREELSAAPDIGWPDCFNSGVYVYKPSMETFSSLLQYAVTYGSFDGGDQGLLNSYFSDWAHKDIQKHLPFIYNTSSVATYSYLPAFKQFGQNTKILHFIGVAKPWLQNFNSETRKVYVASDYQHLANFLQYWWDIFAEDVHSRLSPDMSGIAGALAQLHLGEAKSQEQEAYEEHMRRQCWETGNIDYMGRDSFNNIWKRIQQTINTGSGSGTEEGSSVLQITPSAATQRTSRRTSRSRSATPKRDPKDRSPTPQPEKNLPVDKKEGYQQIITAKNPEGKTKTHTKLVYDPLVEDDQTQEDKYEPQSNSVVTASRDVADGTGTIHRTEINTTPVSSKQSPLTTASSVTEMSPTTVHTLRTPAENNGSADVSNTTKYKSTSNPIASTTTQQPQQQVAQESLAGKMNAFFDSKQPIKVMRKKRHISPSPRPQPTTNATSNNLVSVKPFSTLSSSSSSSFPKMALPREQLPNQISSMTTAILPHIASPQSTASSSKPESRDTPDALIIRTSKNDKKDDFPLTPLSLEKNLTHTPQSSPLCKVSSETNTLETDEASKVNSPPVPPRRKREIRTGKLGKTQ
uniref:glycogenin glucosyltransferase n=1 Tax=Anopheles epiroticus TaxID=199890 RepID=A0A182P4G0_9DIPT